MFEACFVSRFIIAFQIIVTFFSNNTTCYAFAITRLKPTGKRNNCFHKNDLSLSLVQYKDNAENNKINRELACLAAITPPLRSRSDKTRRCSTTNDYEDDDHNTNELYDTDDESNNVDEVVDVAIIGAGIGGLCAGAILNTLYNKKVGIYESHYLPGGCAHAFDRVINKKTRETITFDSGPTILLGCTNQPYNPLQQILNIIEQPIEWKTYTSWGMIEYPTQNQGETIEKKWKLQLGPKEIFENGPLKKFGGSHAIQEFNELRDITQPLVSCGTNIPAMAMRSGPTALIPLLRYFPTLIQLLQQGDLTTSTFGPYIDGPIYTVKDQWLRNWLDALAFSLSGLPANRTSAAAMAYVIYDMHRLNASLDYPKGGYGELIDALVRGVEQGNNGSKVYLRKHVEAIDFFSDKNVSNNNDVSIKGITLSNGKQIMVRDGVICNAPIWSLRKLIQDEIILQKLNTNYNVKGKEKYSWDTSKKKEGEGDEKSSYYHLKGYNEDDKDKKLKEENFLYKTDTAEMTGSFLHLHLVINSTGLNTTNMEAHYTVMDRSLAGSGNENDIGPCGESNMIAVSNPCVIDNTLAPDGYMVLHAYSAGNEPYQVWEKFKNDKSQKSKEEYIKLKEKRAEVLWRAIESVIGSDYKERVVYSLLGSPLTHERFLRRNKGTYGTATEEYLKDGSTPIKNFILCGDSIFPGIGMPAVALSGASAANSLMNVIEHWKCLDRLQEAGKL